MRIWPLYYLGVAIAIAVGLLGHWHRLTRAEILYLLFFVAWKGGTFHANPMGPLWSISCEELFYAVRPTVPKLKGRVSILAVSLLILPISLTSALITKSWFDPVSQFLFFAFGALLALSLHGRDFAIANLARIPTRIMGKSCWV